MEHSHHIKEHAGLFRHTENEDIQKDLGKTLSAIKPAYLFISVAVFYMLIILLGGYIGRQRLLSGIKEPESSIETAVAAVLGLLAFILGFTFSLTWSKFVLRNSLVIQHSKAISVCYLRTSLITQRQKMEVRKLLHEYTNILMEIQSSPEYEKGLARITQLHMEIWQQTTSLAKEDIDSELRSLFISSVNDLISTALERKTIALFIRVPNAIWYSVLFLAFISMLAFGYQAGNSGITKLFQLPLLPIAFGLVIVLIAGLNSQNAYKHFRVTKQPLKAVQEMMGKLYYNT
ncbi:MAG TPA: hypothetical protein VFL47_12340 [Flavisolibacter sp.]|nr:hypothetical protein [Flavisolibacter sp.]